MIVTWSVEGVDWIQKLKADVSTDPNEIATRGIELIIKSLGKSIEEIHFGAVLRVFHSKMKSEDEHWIIYAPAILANAGYYKDAEELEKAVAKEYPHL